MQIIPWIIVACWTVFIGYWAISSFGVKKDVGKTTWQRLWWVRVILAFILVGFFWDRSWIGQSTHRFITTAPSYGLLALIGAVLCVAGIALAIWARVHLGRNWSPAPALKEGHELVTSGPYALVRHPIYTGVILATLGSTLSNPVWLVMFFLVSAMFVWRVRTEEKLMMQQFPDQYPAYKARTYALIPWVW